MVDALQIGVSTFMLLELAALKYFTMSDTLFDLVLHAGTFPLILALKNST